jgi:hypothetical protein
MDQIKVSDQWNFYQAKGIKEAVLDSEIELLRGQHHNVNAKDKEKMKQYQEDQEKISEEAKKYQETSEDHLKHHMVFARAVTLFQVAIAVGAIAALTRRKSFWFISMGFGTIGIVFFILGFLG